MNMQLWLPQAAGAPGPGDIAAYLRQQGWIAQSTPRSAWVDFEKHIESERVILEVPQMVTARDYGRVVAALLEDIARLEARPPSSVLRDIRAASVDIIRLAVDSTSTRDGRIPVESGKRVYEAARNLLLSAACSVLDPRPVFMGGKPEDAMRLLRRARFGHTEVGSFVLTIECSVPPRLQQPMLDDTEDTDAPFERKTCTKLASALHGAESASRESDTMDQLEPFLRRTRDGVSANLCEAVAELVEATDAEAVRASFSFATRRPLGLDNVPRSVVFSGNVAPLLREAASRLREETTYPGVEVVGSVVKLNSAEPVKGGEVVIYASIDGRPRSLRAMLDAAAYQTAIEAHREGALVRCIGDLAREGKYRVLRNPVEFSMTVES